MSFRSVSYGNESHGIAAPPHQRARAADAAFDVVRMRPDGKYVHTLARLPNYPIAIPDSCRKEESGRRCVIWSDQREVRIMPRKLPKRGRNEMARDAHFRKAGPTEKTGREK